MRAVRLPGTTPRPPVHAVFKYFHPLDECQNGGAEWVVIFEEIAPGLFDIRHPTCTRCFAEPLIDHHEIVEGELSAEYRQGPVISEDGQSVVESLIERTPVEKVFDTPKPLARPRTSRQPNRETELITDDGRFDES